MIKHYRYDMIGAFYSGIKEHPQKQMKNLGYNGEFLMDLLDCYFENKQ